MFFRRGRRRFRDFRLSSKLLIVYVALTVLPISLLGVISYRQYEKSIVQQIGEYMPKFLDQANGSIDQHIGKLAVLPEQLFSSTDVVRILRKDSYQSNSDLNTDTYVMNNYLSKTFLEGSNSEILGVFILSKNRLFSASRLDFTGLDSKGLLIPYGQDLELRGGAKLLLSSDFGLKFSSGEPYLMITKQIDDVDNRTSLGTMFIAVQMSFIDRILQNFERNEQAEFWLLNGQGEIFYHTDRARIGGYDAEIREYPVQNGSFRKQAGGKTWIYEQLAFRRIRLEADVQHPAERTDEAGRHHPEYRRFAVCRVRACDLDPLHRFLLPGDEAAHEIGPPDEGGRQRPV
ncbi:hypothetical protein J1TS5_52830 [Paenibacillus macerans]|nr:hypothetical protein J1TS5_52830 [Paenibacillus macerans]